MKPLQWDRLTVAQRYAILRQWDCDDLGGRAYLVEMPWADLPHVLRVCLKQMA